ncbi:MAG: hypothetical protein K8R53_11070, partial [Bacteroidales bacterium]|nr:hypothetical protein [Bacteroidales bacterium]
INSGGTIAAEYAVFEYMNSNGVWIKNGATVDPTYSFHNCTFQNGQNTGLTTLLALNNNQMLTINQANFPVDPGNPTSHNVAKAYDFGHVDMIGATGVFAGPAYEYDTYGLIDWTGFVAGMWTGVISSDWFTSGNWSDGNVPTSVVDVTIPAGTPNDPVINNPNPAECANLLVNPGASLTIQDGTLDAIASVDIDGELGMTSPSSSLYAYNLFFNPGSTDNIINGSIYLEYALWFLDGTNATLDPSSTVYFESNLSTSGLGWQDADAQLGNLVVNKPAGAFIIGTVSTYPPIISGSVDIMGSTPFYTYNYDMYIGEYLDITAGSGLYLWGTDDSYSPTGNANQLNIPSKNQSENTDGGLVEIYGNLVVDGELDIDDGNVLQHGLFTEGTGGIISITTGSFINDHAYGTEAWQYLNGTLNLTDGLFEISGNSISLSSTFVGNISGGIIRTGFSFRANDPGIFEPTGGSVEFICPAGTPFIQCSGGNFFHDFIFNANVLIPIASDIYVMNNLEINSGVLDSDVHDIYVGANWTNNVGDAGFVEGAQTVYFNGDGNIQWMTGAGDTFFNIVQLYNAPGSNLQISEPVTIANILEANYFTFANDICDILGILDISNPNSKFTVNGSGDAFCQSLYQGGSVVNNGGIFDVGDLNESGFYGNWKQNDGITNVNQDAAQYVDINCYFALANGTFSIFGGDGDSYWSYDGDAEVVIGGGVLDFVDVGVRVYESPTWTFTESITGGTIKTSGNFVSINSNFTPAAGVVAMYGGTDAIFYTLSGSYVNNLRINKSGGDESTWSYKDRNGNLVEGGKANSVIMSDDGVVNGNLWVIEGLMSLGFNTLEVYGNSNINGGGTLVVPAGAALLHDNGSLLSVNIGGNLEIDGVPGTPATLSHITGYYGFEIQSGGAISADNAIFEYMGATGVYLKGGSNVNPVASFDDCTFREGAPGGRLMVIHNNQVFDVNNAVFPANTWGGSANVYK